MAEIMHHFSNLGHPWMPYLVQRHRMTQKLACGAYVAKKANDVAQSSEQ